MSEKDVNENKGFSWKSEKDEALGSYIEKGKDSKSYASSIFSSQSSTDYSSSLNGGYEYDFPKDNGYIYSPSGHISSSQSKSAIYSDKAVNPAPPQRGQKTGNGAERTRGERPSQKKNPPSEKNEGRFTFISGLQRNDGRTNTAESSGRKKSQENRQPQKNQKRPAQNGSPQNRKEQNGPSRSRNMQNGPSQSRNMQNDSSQSRNMQGDRRRAEESSLRRRQAEARQNREIERERREDARRDRNDTRFDNSRARGISADESRRARKKKKDTNRKIFAIVCALILVLGAVFTILGYAVVEGVPISKVVVEGSETYKKKAVLSAAGIAVGDNMLLIREKKTNNIITTSLPYIASVEVKYEFPDTLKLNITETRDKIHIMMGKNMITLDENGKVLSNKKKKIDKGNYKIIGLQKQDYNIAYEFEADKDNGNDEKFSLAKEIMAALEKTGITGFRDINFEDMKCITISTTDGISLYVNEKTPLERQFALAKEAIAEKQKSNTKGYFDLRFEEMVVHN